MQVDARIVRLRLAETFVIAREATDFTDVVHVSVTHAEMTGYSYNRTRPHGTVDPRVTVLRVDRVDGTTLAVAINFGAHPCVGTILWPWDVSRDIPGEVVQGKLVGMPTARLLGLPRTGPPTSWTIWLGDPDDMARRAEAASGTYRRLKLKLGGADGLDVERVQAVRSATDLPLQVDVNEAWSLDEALAGLPLLAELGVDLCEQPLRAGDEGRFRLRRESPIAIFVDEDCHTLADVALCAEFAHGINIKLAKSGGIREAIRMVHAARALRLGVMLGCMLESGLGIAAGCCVAPLCDRVDLDGNLLLEDDPFPGVELVDGVQVPASSPGLGVSPRA